MSYLIPTGRNRIIVGQREEGKTSLAIWLALQTHDVVIVIDPRGMIEGYAVYNAAELQEAMESRIWEKPYSPYSSADDTEYAKTGFVIVCRFETMDHRREFAEYCAYLFPPRFEMGGFAFVVDEAGLFQTANSCDENLARIVKQHPTKPPSVDVLQTSHVLHEFCSQHRSLYDELFVFQLKAPNDLEALVRHTGDESLRDVVANLPQHVCLRYFYGRKNPGEEQYQIWVDPSIWRIKATTQDNLGLDSEEILTDPEEENFTHGGWTYE